jgi:hypothetical protein
VLTDLYLAAILVALFATVLAAFAVQVVMLRRIRLLVHAVGAMVIQESRRLRGLHG